MQNKPTVIFSTEVKPEWLDYNNHMNVEYYLLVFEKAFEQLLVSLDLGEMVAKSTGISTMALECHITFDKEALFGQELEVRTQLVDYDHKRMHLYFEMYVKGEDGYLSSTLEQISMCIDLANRKSTSFPDRAMAKIEHLSQLQSHLEYPDNIGRKIGIRRSAKKAM